MAFGPRDRTAGCQSGQGRGESAGSLIFGGPAPTPPPPHRAPSPAKARPQPLSAAGAAGASRSNMPDVKTAEEAHGFRRQRAPQRDVRLQYDDYVAASEEQAFDALRSTLGKLERRAEREHNMYSGAAGYSTEKRVARGDFKLENPRQKLATPRGDTDCVASLISNAPRPGTAPAASYAAPTCSSHRKSAVPPLPVHGGSESSMAARISSRRRQNSARRMSAGTAED